MGMQRKVAKVCNFPENCTLYRQKRLIFSEVNDMNNDIDFVDSLVRKAYKHEAPRCPDFANIALEPDTDLWGEKQDSRQSFLGSLMNLIKSKKDSVKSRFEEMSDRSLDGICAAGQDEKPDDEETREADDELDKK